jgi:hypothetical protein
MIASASPEPCDAIWDEGDDPKSIVVTLTLMDMLREGSTLAIPEVGVNIGDSITNEGVRSTSDDIVASLDVGILV